jgi:hypothetical protein
VRDYLTQQNVDLMASSFTRSFTHWACLGWYEISQWR